MGNFRIITKFLPMVMAIATILTNASSTAQTTPSEKLAIVVVDQRPPEESKKHTLSLWVGSCDYFVTRLDDAGMGKSRLEQLSEDLSGSLTGKFTEPFYVKHYTIYLNAGVQMVDAAFASAAAAAGGVVVESDRKVSRPKCPREQMKGGWFDSSEVSNGRPPLIADVELVYAGTTFRARKVMSLDHGFNDNSKSPKYGNIKADIFRKMNQDLAAQISARFQ